jgi:hypothetical protein
MNDAIRRKVGRCGCSSHGRERRVMVNSLANVDVDATGPRKSRGPDAGGAAQTGSGPTRSAGLHPTACSVVAGGFRVHLARPNGVTLPKAARDGQRKVRDAARISAALSPGGRLLPATGRQGSCPTHCLRPRHRHLADHGPAPTGSNRPLSRLAVTQARNQSPALAHRRRPARNQIEAPPCRHQATPPSSHP